MFTGGREELERLPRNIYSDSYGSYDEADDKPDDDKVEVPSDKESMLARSNQDWAAGSRSASASAVQGV